MNCLSCQGKGDIGCPVCRERGYWICTACGGRGVIQWQGGDKDRCKVCSNGRFKCAACKSKKTVKCLGCDGRKTTEAPCAACLGLGHRPCPDCSPSECVLCRGEKEIPCWRCDGRGEFTPVCPRCLDTGKKGCEDCPLDARRPCPDCHGAGKVRYVYSGTGDKAGTKKCDRCKGRGYERCDTCERGLVPCKQSPRGEDCRACSRGRTKCPACRG